MMMMSRNLYSGGMILGDDDDKFGNDGDDDEAHDDNGIQRNQVGIREQGIIYRNRMPGGMRFLDCGIFDSTC